MCTEIRGNFNAVQSSMSITYKTCISRIVGDEFSEIFFNRNVSYEINYKLL